MPTTPKGYPYPTPDDPVAAGADDIRALAERADDTSLVRINPSTLGAGANAIGADALFVSPVNAGDGWALWGSMQGEPQPRWIITRGGMIQFGDGANPLDAHLYRSNPQQLQVDGGITGVAPTGGVALGARKSAADAGWRVYVDGDGKLSWGAGDGFYDTSLYRSAVSQLKTNAWLMVGGGVNVDMDNLGNGLYFGSAGDVSLYRGGADQLATDDAFVCKWNAGLGQTPFVFYFADVGGLRQIHVGARDSAGPGHRALYIDND